MWIDAAKVDFPCNQEDHRANRREAAIAPGFSFGGLKQAIQGFDEAIGLAGAGPGHNAIQMFSNHFSYHLHWLDFRSVDVGAPLIEHVGNNPDLLAVEDLPQLFAVEPGPRGALAGDTGNQPV